MRASKNHDFLQEPNRKALLAEEQRKNAPHPINLRTREQQQAMQHPNGLVAPIAIHQPMQFNPGGQFFFEIKDQLYQVMRVMGLLSDLAAMQNFRALLSAGLNGNPGMGFPPQMDPRILVMQQQQAQAQLEAQQEVRECTKREK